MHNFSPGECAEPELSHTPPNKGRDSGGGDSEGEAHNTGDIHSLLPAVLPVSFLPFSPPLCFVGGGWRQCHSTVELLSSEALDAGMADVGPLVWSSHPHPRPRGYRCLVRLFGRGGDSLIPQPGGPAFLMGPNWPLLHFYSSKIRTITPQRLKEFVVSTGLFAGGTPLGGLLCGRLPPGHAKGKRGT